MEPGAWSAMPGGTNLFPLCGGEELGKVDAAVAVLVPLGHPLADLVVRDGGLAR